MIYPKKINAKKSDNIIKIFMALTILIAIVLTIINQIVNPNVPWAALTNSGLIYVWIVVLYSIYRNVNIAGHVLVQTIAISLLTVFIDYKIGFRGWSLSIAIPIILMIANLAMLILTIVSYKKYLRYAIYQLIILIFSVLPVIFIIEKLVKEPTLGIIATGISVVNLILTLILSSKDIKEAVKRKFHM